MIFAYARLSKETEGSVSIDDQMAKINKYADANELGIDSWHIDKGLSGKNLDRPEIKLVLQRARKGDKIIVLKLDRLTRSVGDLDRLVQSGIDLVSVQERLDTSTASGRMMINMLGVLAQWERETISERTSAALTYRRRNGRVYGTTPFGWRREGETLVIDQTEQETLHRIKQLREWKYSFKDVCNTLNAENRASKTGVPWNKSMLQSLMNSKLFGELS